MTESALFFINFTFIFQVMTLKQEDPISDVTKSCQDAPLFSIDGNRGEHVQKTCSYGIYILYTCILRYDQTFIL